jgi:hypothetical protein
LKRRVSGIGGGGEGEVDVEVESASTSASAGDVVAGSDALGDGGKVARIYRRRRISTITGRKDGLRTYRGWDSRHNDHNSGIPL